MEQNNNTPKLIYLYISDIGRCIKHQGFNFRDDFYIDFNFETKNFRITKNNNNKFWFIKNNKNIINSIDLILGANGSGKTTLLKLLAGSLASNIVYTESLNRDKEGNLLPIKKDSGYFLLYFLKENEFIIYYHNIHIVDNKYEEFANNWDEDRKNVYDKVGGLKMKYNFDNYTHSFETDVIYLIQKI